jgi:hypothetical protein
VTPTRLLLFAWLGRLLRSWSRLAFRAQLVLLVGVLSPSGALADELVPRLVASPWSGRDKALSQPFGHQVPLQNVYCR